MTDTKCGCKVERDGKTYSDRIDYCPLHREAEAMREALRSIERHEYRSDRRHRGMVDVIEIEQLKRTARSVLSRIEGGDV